MTLFFNYRNGTIYILVLLLNKLYIIIFYSSNSSNSNSNIIIIIISVHYFCIVHKCKWPTLLDNFS